MACKSSFGYLFAILLERLKLDEVTKFSNVLSSSLFFRVMIWISEKFINIWSSYKISYGVKSVVNNNTFQNDLT